jgi:hypothetical protein
MATLSACPALATTYVTRQVSYLTDMSSQGRGSLSSLQKAGRLSGRPAFSGGGVGVACRDRAGRPSRSTRRALLALPQGPSRLRRGNGSRWQAGRRSLSARLGELPAVLPESFDNAPECHPSPWAGRGALRRGHAIAIRPWSHRVKVTPVHRGCLAAAPAYPKRHDNWSQPVPDRGRSDPQVRGDGKRQLHRSQDHRSDFDGRWRARIAAQPVSVGLRPLPRHPARARAARLNTAGTGADRGPDGLLSMAKRPAVSAPSRGLRNRSSSHDGT